MIEIHIAESVIAAFPTVRVAAFRASEVDTALARIDTDQALASAAALVRTRFSDRPPAEDALISGWRHTYRNMGVRPSRFRCSYEALARRAIADKPLRTGVGAVDFYNAHCLLHQACLGAYDATKLLEVPIELRHASPAIDNFEPLGGSAEDFPLNDALAVYAQGTRVLCWGFNCRDSCHTALDASSKDVVFLAESVTSEQAGAAQAALQTMRDELLGAGASVSDVVQAHPEHARIVLAPPQPTT